MTFHVNMISEAENDYHALQQYIASRSKRGAEAWTIAFKNTLSRLEENADAFPIADEDSIFTYELRHAIFKTRHGGKYRILFTVRGNRVTILHIRGPGQDLVDPMDIREPD